MQAIRLNVNIPESYIDYFGRLKGSLALSLGSMNTYSYLTVYKATDYKPRLTIYQPPEHELVVQFSLLHEYIDNGGIGRQIYPILLKIDYLKPVHSFMEINQYWDQLFDEGYCSKLLNRALVYLVEMASFFNRAGNSSFALKIHGSILQQPSCLHYAPQIVSDVLLQRGRIYLRQKKFDLSLQDFKQAMQMEPENPDVYYRLAFLYQDLQQTDEAEKSFDRAGELYKNQPDLYAQCCYYRCKGELYYYRRDFDNALRNFRKMKDYAKECNDLNLLYEATGFMANIYYQNRNYSQALTAYRENEQTA